MRARTRRRLSPEKGDVIARFAAFAGPLPAHPRLGTMTRDEWIRFHRLHCAHHLGFVVPDRDPTASA